MLNVERFCKHTYYTYVVITTGSISDRVPNEYLITVLMNINNFVKIYVFFNDKLFMVLEMCINRIDWVKYYMKRIYSASQYMHLNAPRTACLCIDTCSSKQTAIPPERFAGIVSQESIASAGTVSAWHRDRSDHTVYPCREAYKEW